MDRVHKTLSSTHNSFLWLQNHKILNASPQRQSTKYHASRLRSDSS